MKIYSVTTSLSRYGGAQKVLKDIHDGLSSHFDCKILGMQAFDKLHPNYKIKEVEYIKLGNPMVLKDSVILVHARNMLPLLFGLNRLLFLNAKIVFISHSVFSTHKNLTPLPKVLVSISNKVSANLIDYFAQKKENIHLIYNGVPDAGREEENGRKYKEDEKIKILYTAKIYPLKRQMEIVKFLKGKLAENIQIYFAGDGEEYEQLAELCKDSKQFFTLGFISNIHDIIADYDFLMLYSRQEGLPISLIEGAMHSKPLLINDVGGNLEIGIPGENGLELSMDWDKMLEQLNSVNAINVEQYLDMSGKSRRNYLNKFQYHVMINNYVDLINSL